MYCSLLAFGKLFAGEMTIHFMLMVLPAFKKCFFHLSRVKNHQHFPLRKTTVSPNLSVQEILTDTKVEILEVDVPSMLYPMLYPSLIAFL